MATSYPVAIDGAPATHADVSDAVIAVETELGPSPSGAYSTVAARLANTLPVVVWTGSTYSYIPDGPALFIGPTDPSTVGEIAQGSLWVVTAAGTPTGGGDGATGWGPQIGIAVKATPDNVGYRGSLSALTVLNPGDPLPASLGQSYWDGDAIIVNGPTTQRSLEGYHIHGCVVSYVPLTVKHTVVECNIGNLFGITGSGVAADILAEDTTVIGSADPAVGPTSNTQVNGFSSDGRIRLRRCKTTGTADGVHAVFRGTDAASGSLISQVWIQNTFLDNEQHCDGIQLYNPEVGQPEGYVTVEFSSVATGVYGPTGDAINSSITCGGPTGVPTGHLRLEGNVLPAGGYHAHLQVSVSADVIDNNFGLVDAAHGEYGLVTVSGTIASWSGNVDGNGNPVNDPTA